MWPWPWPNDLDIRTWLRYSEGVPNTNRLCQDFHKLEHYRQTDRQTDTRTDAAETTTTTHSRDSNRTLSFSSDVCDRPKCRSVGMSAMIERAICWQVQHSQSPLSTRLRITHGQNTRAQRCCTCFCTSTVCQLHAVVDRCLSVLLSLYCQSSPDSSPPSQSIAPRQHCSTAQQQLAFCLRCRSSVKQSVYIRYRTRHIISKPTSSFVWSCLTTSFFAYSFEFPSYTTSVILLSFLLIVYLIYCNQHQQITVHIEKCRFYVQLCVCM